MNAPSFALSEDLGPATMVVAGVLLALSLLLLVYEVWTPKPGRLWVFLSGCAATLAVAGALLRPVSVEARTSPLGPRVLVLVDQSRRLQLPAGDEQRRQVAARAVEQLAKHYQSARVSVFGFSSGDPAQYPSAPPRPTSDSDLTAAIAQLTRASGERPSAVVVVSDGRLTRPTAEDTSSVLLPGMSVPVHTVGVVEKAPKDASIRSVRAAGAAVAHQPLAITVEVGCSGLDCSNVPVTIRELLRGEKPAELARGTVSATDGAAKIELSITLERSGSRVIEVAIDAPDDDTIPQNDARYLTFSVTKERIRLLHLAGRPTFDVRALRTWLKRDESVDVIAFFILRGDTDDPGANERELALIRFPVEELFTEHLPSFDAIVLQDIDAIRYKLSRYLVRLEAYVKTGGGLIMVGGPSSFGGGNYAGTPLDGVLPVEQPRQEKEFDSGEFNARFTDAGRATPITRNLRTLLNDELPPFAGANMLGVPRPGAIVLLEHPQIRVGQRAMPILALGEAGDGRSIALGVDSTYRLAYGQLAATVGGRGYGALWDGLLGWLMRDPRFEAARVEVVGECIAGEPTTFRVQRLPGMAGDIQFSIEPLDAKRGAPVERSIPDNRAASSDIVIEGLRPGGYTARVAIGAAPATRQDFGCEAGGEAFADSRPDNERLQRIAQVNGGRFVTPQAIEELPEPSVVRVTAERRVSPFLPAWVWTLAAAGLLGLHWLARRQSGYA